MKTKTAKILSLTSMALVLLLASPNSEAQTMTARRVESKLTSISPSSEQLNMTICGVAAGGQIVTIFFNNIVGMNQPVHVVGKNVAANGRINSAGSLAKISGFDIFVKRLNWVRQTPGQQAGCSDWAMSGGLSPLEPSEAAQFESFGN